MEKAEIIQFPNLLKYEGLIAHGFTSRRGGVSSGECSSLNMGFNRKDTRENVMENYQRVAQALGIRMENMVFSNQVHDIKIRVVGPEDRGKGILRQSDILGFDGLVTNHREVALVTFYADCVPVFLWDPVKKAIGLCHSGWRGTVREIAAETVSVMGSTYGCHPEDIIAAIGPSIGECCFEVGGEVFEAFEKQLSPSVPYCRKTGEDKWHIHLQGIIQDTLLRIGLKHENVYNSGLCTKCHPDTFFSHRFDAGKTGSMAAILQLK